MGLIKKEIGSSVDLSQFLDLLCLAIIADVMPLHDINRTLVIKGLEQMSLSTRPCMVIIRDMLSKKQLTAEDIAFQIAPRVNSAGRMEDASYALAFLNAPNEQVAYKQYELLNQLNQIRKTTEAEATENAMRQVHKDDNIIVVSNTHWHEGVVGIVASRLVQRFGKPAIVLSIENGVAKGSARSIGNISIYELIKTQEKFLERFGGHKMAAGLGLKEENISAFKEALNKEAESIPPEDYIPQEEVLGEIDSSAIDLELLNLLEEFEPYGESNPRPRFLANKAQIISIKKLGKEKEHAKIELRLCSQDSQTYDLMYFRCDEEFRAGQEISCSYTLNKNVFNGKTSIQFMLDRILS
jgi:single-stranded-DNA-specific exonuclease